MKTAIKIIVNADDFGLDQKSDIEIVRLLNCGHVTSVSAMATRLVNRKNSLRDIWSSGRVGLHFEVTDKDIYFKIKAAMGLSSVDIATIQGSILSQLEDFERLFGCLPTHLDSHHNIHFHPQVLEVFRTISADLRRPVRGVDALVVRPLIASLINEEPKVAAMTLLDSCLIGVDPIKEIYCHPGIYSEKLARVTSYAYERQLEIDILREFSILSKDVDELELVSWVDYSSRVF